MTHNVVNDLRVDSDSGSASLKVTREYVYSRRADVNDLPQDLYDTLKTWLDGRTN